MSPRWFPEVSLSLSSLVHDVDDEDDSSSSVFPVWNLR